MALGANGQNAIPGQHGGLSQDRLDGQVAWHAHHGHLGG